MKKQSIAVLKKKLWKEFSIFIRNRDGGICFTCDARCEGSNYHAGHFIAKAAGGLALYFNEDNVHGQCMRCNIHLGGNQWEYGQRLGKKKVNELMKLKNETWKWGVNDYLEKISYYKTINENSID